MAAGINKTKGSHTLRNMLFVAGGGLLLVCCGFFALVSTYKPSPSTQATVNASVVTVTGGAANADASATSPIAVPSATAGPTAIALPPTIIPKPTATLLAKTATAAAKSTNQAVSDAALAVIAKQTLSNNFTSAQLVTVGGYTTATIVYDDSVEFDENSMIDTPLRNLIHLAPAVFTGLTNAPDLFVIISTAKFTDIHGNTSTENAVEFRITKALNSKMNWPNFDRRNTANVLIDQNDESGVNVNPALIKFWVKSQNQ